MGRDPFTASLENTVRHILVSLDVKLRSQVAASVVPYVGAQGQELAHVSISRPRHLLCQQCSKPLPAAHADPVNPANGRHLPHARGTARHRCGAFNDYAVACARVDLCAGMDWTDLLQRLLALVDEKVHLT